MARDNFSIPGYDAWKTRAPEDEPGYWDDKEDEPDDEEDEPDEDGEPRWPRATCSMCGAITTRDPVYADLCSKCCRADNE